MYYKFKILTNSEDSVNFSTDLPKTMLGMFETYSNAVAFPTSVLHDVKECSTKLSGLVIGVSFF